jgi:hypothetical protein
MCAPGCDVHEDFYRTMQIWCTGTGWSPVYCSNRPLMGTRHDPEDLWAPLIGVIGQIRDQNTLKVHRRAALGRSGTTDVCAE